MSKIEQGTQAAQEAAKGLWSDIRQHRMFKDRLFLVFIIINILLMLVTVAVLLARLRPKSSVVPVYYSSLLGFYELGPWYQNYTPGVFSMVATFGNMFLAMRSFERSRVASFFLLFGTTVVNIMALVISLVLISHIEV